MHAALSHVVIGCPPFQVLFCNISIAQTHTHTHSLLLCFSDGVLQLLVLSCCRLLVFVCWYVSYMLSSLFSDGVLQFVVVADAASDGKTRELAT